MRVLLVLASLILVSSAQILGQSQSSQESSPPHLPSRFAILIGVGKYDSNTGIGSLIGPVKDVEEMRDTLIKTAAFDKSNIVLLTASEPNNQPTRTNIEVALSEMKHRVQEGDLLVVMFSGHGMESNGEAMLLAQDSRNTGDPIVLKKTAVPLSDVTEIVQSTKASQVIVLLDACRGNLSSSASKGETANVMTPAYKVGLDPQTVNKGIKTFVTLYATSTGQLAWIDQKRQMGYFTAALVDGLNGQAAINGKVTLGSLMKYVETAVPKAAEPNEQVPDVLMRGDANELVLARIDVPPPDTFGSKLRPLNCPPKGALAYGWSTPSQKTDDNPDFYIMEHPLDRLLNIAPWVKLPLEQRHEVDGLYAELLTHLEKPEPYYKGQKALETENVMQNISLVFSNSGSLQVNYEVRTRGGISLKSNASNIPVSSLSKSGRSAVADLSSFATSSADNACVENLLKLE